MKRYGKKFLDFGETQPIPPDPFIPLKEVHTTSFTHPHTCSVAQEMCAGREGSASAVSPQHFD